MWLYIYFSQGEMHFLPTEPNSWFNLPRNGGVAYAAQESWVINDTIRVCRFFYLSLLYSYLRIGKHSFRVTFQWRALWNRYALATDFRNIPSLLSVIYQCALTSDLELLSSGDHTEVGERGLTLSGGQKVCIDSSDTTQAHNFYW